MYPAMSIEHQSHLHEKPDMLGAAASAQSFVSLMSFIQFTGPEINHSESKFKQADIVSFVSLLSWTSPLWFCLVYLGSKLYHQVLL